MKIGIIGTGNIAQYLLESINGDGKVVGEIVSIFGRNLEVGLRLESQYSAKFYTDFQQFIQSTMDVVVEAATIEVAIERVEEVLDNKKDLVLSSIGAFKDMEYLNEMIEVARKNQQHIYLPSGAIGGLDLLQSANSLGGLKEVRITTRKSYQSLGLDVKHVEQCIFEGVALDAIEKFPKNVNVALLLSIAGLGADKTAVRVIADPNIQRNTHHIEAKGDFGKMNLLIENEPMPNNPKTSYLAALSIVSTLQNKGNAITIGS
ncbi:aspartate dehydrogenase [Sporosarcina sp. P21c]|uniref:aspartate dehydrogenase n=1 Tax=unclassified Sporosarcina TaxID=2647733 RepID=UPI000C16D9C3|nr:MULTISPECIES: aspartate dehydrogenase [unclassified Sporosarcina]PIC67427.1 aspartate dehydrogenase [Sporosarcina sp. P16a]PIC83246.1 aspartate dehydrogenase [Sporosarcina sp. P1]PIC89682.1 aspartate dehydrogenase [Sporosarcina sp. P21c]PIC92878.1 aspartate dehydrogenase [Sporosarcina sp. P25]